MCYRKTLSKMNLDNNKESIIVKARTMRKAADAIAEIRPIIKRFDGKCYNKRFDNAILEETRTKDRFISCSHRYGNVDISYHDNSTTYYYDVNMLSFYEITDADDKRKTKHYYNESMDLYQADDVRRIDADKMIKALNDKRAELLKDAYKLETAIETIETTLDRINQEISTLQAIINPLPYEIKSRFDMYEIRI